MRFATLGKERSPCRAISCLGPQAGAGLLYGREGDPRDQGKPLPCSQPVGAWGGMSSWQCPLLPLLPAVQPLSLPFLLRAGVLSALEGNCVARLWWARKEICIGKQVPSQSAMPAGSQLQALCLSTWLAPGHVSPSALARSPCPGEEDEGHWLLSPAHPPGIALSLAPRCWGGIHLLQPIKGTGSGSVSSPCPTPVSHQDFCLLVWMCREATD